MGLGQPTLKPAPPTTFRDGCKPHVDVIETLAPASGGHCTDALLSHLMRQAVGCNRTWPVKRADREREGTRLKHNLIQRSRSSNTYLSRAEVVEVLSRLVAIRAAIIDCCAATHYMPRTTC